MEKPTRPVRNRRHSRRAWPPGESHRQVKRLFTPEIKKMLKDWLVRRRENPYPSRDEKKALAFETGLTYTQICNWFANWRRKLKNSEREAKKSWGHLIKNYNDKAKGNVEQFSICSGDSIWEDDENASHFSDSELFSSDYDEDDKNFERHGGLNNNLNDFNKNQTYVPGFYIENNQNRFSNLCNDLSQSQNCQINLPCDNEQQSSDNNSTIHSQLFSSKPKYKQQMMEKYLRDNSPNKSNVQINSSSPELSKWLESAAKFTPNKNNYFIEWSNERKKSGQKRSKQQIDHLYESIHQKEELDAAEALANLAFNCRQRMMNTTNLNVV